MSWPKKLNRKIVLIAILVVIVALAGIVWIMHQRDKSAGGDLYYDGNGCAQSRSGGIHPDYCIQR